VVPQLGVQQGRRRRKVRYQVVQDLDLLLGLLCHVSQYMREPQDFKLTGIVSLGKITVSLLITEYI
jgi:hypothetical protein